MEVIFILIGASLILAGGFLGAFLWAMRSGQYEDDVTPSIRILNDNTPNQSAKTNNHEA
ncbi:cbb3-type cytochrome oxidase assembly protein CcoS [Sanyastnella coralliicola]|uniref:cbb3-type cytochrome oxidase assembly protein CcoS n=1 Tax=Sanyastnella coralliicola TaxID=3069118 RepID=UPI0027B9BDDB|nr:cbb3-type cytochrome oxidase assembly protein CcoS [Longitalea sp. SCSIO 12813]